MLHKPELTKSSCNHCIAKANKKHEQALGTLAYSSVASTAPAGVSSAHNVMSKGSIMNNAANEFLSVSQSDGGKLPYNLSMSQIPTTQFESQSYMQMSDQVSTGHKLLHHANIAKNAKSII